MSLHVPTIFVALCLSFALFVTTLTFARPLPGTGAELRLWMRSVWLLLAAFVALFSRTFMPEWFAVLFGNGLIFASLSLMNTTFITNKVTAQGSSNVTRFLQANSSDEELLDRLFLQTLSRRPTADEKAAALALRRNRTEWAEDLQWTLLNKLDFLFNY